MEPINIVPARCADIRPEQLRLPASAQPGSRLGFVSVGRVNTTGYLINSQATSSDQDAAREALSRAGLEPVRVGRDAEYWVSPCDAAAIRDSQSRYVDPQRNISHVINGQRGRRR